MSHTSRRPLICLAKRRVVRDRGACAEVHRRCGGCTPWRGDRSFRGSSWWGRSWVKYRSPYDDPNPKDDFTTETQNHREIGKEEFSLTLCLCGEPYSSTLSSSFFLPQSAAACTNASTKGCGFP